MLTPVRTVAPADTPVSVTECKSHLRVTHSGDDTLIGLYLQAAIDRLDGWAGLLGRCLFTQTWRQDLHCWPQSGIIRLPFPDVQSIGSLVYSDTADAEQTVAGALYALSKDAGGSFLWFKDAFTAPPVYDDRPDPIRCTFVAGYGVAAAVPAALKAALLLMVGDFYENREDTVVGPGIDVRPLPRGVDALIAPYRRVGL